MSTESERGPSKRGCSSSRFGEGEHHASERAREDGPRWQSRGIAPTQRSSNRACARTDGRHLGSQAFAHFHERARRSDLGPAERSSKARNRAVRSIGRVTEMPEARHPRSSWEDNAQEQTEQGCPPKRLERRETLQSRAVQVDSISRRRKLPKRAVIARWSRAMGTGEAQASTRNRNQRGAGARS